MLHKYNIHVFDVDEGQEEQIYKAKKEADYMLDAIVNKVTRTDLTHSYKMKEQHVTAERYQVHFHGCLRDGEK